MKGGLMNDQITIEPKICHGKPIIRGTRTPVTVVLGALAGGDSFEQIEKDYGITTKDIRACIAFAAQEVDRHSYHSLCTGSGTWSSSSTAVYLARRLNWLTRAIMRPSDVRGMAASDEIGTIDAV